MYDTHHRDQGKAIKEGTVQLEETVQLEGTAQLLWYVKTRTLWL
jgi:hypothetical protein